MKEKDEIEVKFCVNDFGELRKKVLKVGSEMQHLEKKFEENIRLDDNKKSLTRKGEVLRLRKWGDEYTLTFKGPRIKSEFKRRLEYEVRVDNLLDAERILTRLGFREYLRYEKKREKFKFSLNARKLEICFDEMPYGNFVEIEGNEEDILHVAEILEFKWDTRVVEDYIGIFRKIRRDKNLHFSDLTFKNFAEVDLQIPDFSKYIQRLCQA